MVGIRSDWSSPGCRLIPITDKFEDLRAKEATFFSYLLFVPCHHLFVDLRTFSTVECSRVLPAFLARCLDEF